MTAELDSNKLNSPLSSERFEEGDVRPLMSEQDAFCIDEIVARLNEVLKTQHEKFWDFDRRDAVNWINAEKDAP